MPISSSKLVNVILSVCFIKNFRPDSFYFNNLCSECALATLNGESDWQWQDRWKWFEKDVGLIFFTKESTTGLISGIRISIHIRVNRWYKGSEADTELDLNLFNVNNVLLKAKIFYINNPPQSIRFGEKPYFSFERAVNLNTWSDLFCFKKYQISGPM